MDPSTSSSARGFTMRKQPLSAGLIPSGAPRHPILGPVEHEGDDRAKRHGPAYYKEENGRRRTAAKGNLDGAICTAERRQIQGERRHPHQRRRWRTCQRTTQYLKWLERWHTAKSKSQSRCWVSQLLGRVTNIDGVSAAHYGSIAPAPIVAAGMTMSMELVATYLT